MPVRYCDAAPSCHRYELLVAEILRSGVAAAPRQEIVYRERRHSYQELSERVGRLANALAELGVEPGTTVAMMDWDSHRYLEAFLAVPMMGAVLMTVNVRLSADQIAYTINHSQAEVLILHEEFAEMVAKMRSALRHIRHIVWVSDEAVAPPTELLVAGHYEALIQQQSECHRWPSLEEDSMAVQFYTTGTTGIPKCVAFSHRQIVLKTLVTYGAWAAQAPGQSFRQGDVYMPITPMFHVQAWSFPYVALLLGVKQVYPGRYDPKRILALKQREGVTFSHCVPTILEMMLRAPEGEKVDLRGWKICVGGARLTHDLASAALDRGIDVFAGYGLSETYAGTLLTGFRGEPVPDDREAEIATRTKAGRALPMVDVRLVDENMNDLPADDRAVGEVVVRTPWAVTGYLDMPEDSEALWRGGYLHTQDLARMDADGYITILDRSKDVIKSGGEWISSLELENLLTLHAEVLEAAVIPTPDARWGERPLALIVPVSEPGDQLSARLKEYLKSFVTQGKLSSYAVPVRIELVSMLPKTSVGKLDKKLLRRTYSSQA